MKPPAGEPNMKAVVSRTIERPSMGLGERRLERCRSLVGDLDLELMLKRVLEAGRELTGARYAALGILDSRHEQLDQIPTAGIDEQARRELGDLPRDAVYSAC